MALAKENVQSFLSSITQPDATNIVPVSGGDWSQAFFFEREGDHKIIRFSQTNEDFLKDQFAHGFTSPGLPIPEIEEIGTAFGGYYAISPKIEGTMIDHLNPEAMRSFTPNLLKLFNALRTADLAGTSGYGGWDHAGQGQYQSWSDFLLSINRDDSSSRIAWRPALEKRPDTKALFDRVYQVMHDLLPKLPNTRHLIHNDLLHFNLLLNDGNVAGVIDWGCSLYGDYLYDLAMFDLWQFYYPSMQGIDFKGEAKSFFADQGADITNFEARLKCYQCHLTLDSIKYTSYKDNDHDLNLISGRISQLIG
jgi:fructosamine-3-kinase